MRRIMIDSAKCDGCKSCSLACMQAHRETPGTIYDLDVTDCANESRNFIYKNQKGGYTPLFCRHCDKPECVMSCMSGALTKDEKTGMKIIKCDFCIGKGEDPSCVKACPKEAIWVEEV